MSFDLVGARMRGEEPLPYMDIIRYGYEVMTAFYTYLYQIGFRLKECKLVEFMKVLSQR